MLLIDENIRDSGGHYLELAQLLMQGAKQHGYRPTLATNQSFDQGKASELHCDIRSVFEPRRMNAWSLGVDGNSLVQRAGMARPVGASFPLRASQQVRDALSRRQRNPQRMIQQWSDGFLKLINDWKPEAADQILVNTADDFVMLALSNALQQYKSSTPLSVSAIFHFALFASNKITRRAREFGQQVNAAVQASQPHSISLFATTHSLSSQLEAVGVDAAPVPYPTRSRQSVMRHEKRNAEQPLKILMAGMPRAEKGRDKIATLLSAIHRPFLADNQYRFSLQVRPDTWKRLIPSELHPAYHAAVDRHSADTVSPLEIVSSDLPGQEYHQWLGTADVGLFLYDPVRYEARCSGVLLEMMVAGVPVVVPEKCWLDDQLQVAGGDGAIGYRYRTIDQIPSLLQRIRGDYVALRDRSQRYADVMRKRHTGANTIKQMGMPVVNAQHRMAS
ncbi:glycosyltransferase [Stieleria marina]